MIAVRQATKADGDRTCLGRVPTSTLTTSLADGAGVGIQGAARLPGTPGILPGNAYMSKALRAQAQGETG